ncbi:MAG: carboxymuconolactone decarboxylase [Sphingopyxis macrogoltabida]|uniref:Carboxymuconolactone decarboxylase n=1 Tax=Sphingopyxis macrogoltabida TaxID=33050 RepID=A0A2W5L508_SPHMC|nr:MAG: carboxymuconolactone decarboxylase [Sphingopyxis macrogoltabida]
MAALDSGPDDGARIPLLAVDEMSDAQRALYEDVVSGPRGQMIGPLRAAIHSPALAERWSKLGEYLRFETCLPLRLSELAIIVCGRRWSAQVEWWVHARVAIETGLPQAVVMAIRDLEAPVFDDPADLEIYEYARLLQETGQVPAAVHGAVKARWGTRGVVELTAIIGYYTMVAMTLNAHQLPVPDGSRPLADTGALVTLAPGRLDRAAVA